jgi:hypothetical protein
VSRKGLKGLTIVTACVLVLLAADSFMTTVLFLNAKKSPLVLHAREPLPCGAVPMRFLMEQPECANLLVKSMNISNFNILPAETVNVTIGAYT